MIAPAAIEEQAVRTLAAERHGVTAFRLHYTYDERGPGHHVTRDVDSIVLRSDGSAVKARVLSPAHAKATAVEDDYRLPLTPEALAEYRFAASPCNGCAVTTAAIAFTSLKRDPDHGDGIMLVDVEAHRVLRLDFQPSALPAHADHGTIAVRFGAVLPDLWDVVETKQHYDGHLLFLHGYADVVQTQSAYQRFATVDEGLAALDGAK